MKKKYLPLHLQFFAEEGTNGKEESAEPDKDVETPAAEGDKGKTETDEKEKGEAEPEKKEGAIDPEEMARLVKERVEEEVKKSKMDPEELKQYEETKRGEELAKREAEISLRERKADAKSILAEKGLPDTFLDMVLAGAEDTKAIEERVEKLKAQFDVAVQSQVESRLKGKTPGTGTGSTGMDAEAALAAEVASYL